MKTATQATFTLSAVNAAATIQARIQRESIAEATGLALSRRLKADRRAA